MFKDNLMIKGLGIVGVILSLSTISSSIYVVNEGEVGVVKTLGKISNVANPGLNFKVPLISSVDKVTVKQQVFDAPPMSAGVKGKQSITVDTSVDFTITNPSLFIKSYTTDTLNSNISRLQQEAVKNVTLKYSLDEAIGDKRQEISSTIQAELISSAQTQGLPITINNLTISDIAPPTAIAEAIQRTTVAMQDAKTAEQLKAKATNEAEAKVIEAKGQAEANAVIAKSLKEDGAKIVELKSLDVQAEAIAKWNGALPTTTAGDSIPFLNLNK